jgi:hypothetical protein
LALKGQQTHKAKHLWKQIIDFRKSEYGEKSGLKLRERKWNKRHRCWSEIPSTQRVLPVAVAGGLGWDKGTWDINISASVTKWSLSRNEGVLGHDGIRTERGKAER